MNSFTKVLKSGEFNFTAEKFCYKEKFIATQIVQNVQQEDVLAAQAQLQVEAENILNTAKEQAALIIEAAKAQADELVKSVEVEGESMKQRGWQEGYAQGNLQATNEIRIQAEAILNEAKNIVLQTCQKCDEIFEHNQRGLVDLAVSIAEKIVEREIILDRSTLQTSVRKALRHVTNRDNLVLRISPQDVPCITQSELLELGIPEVKLVEDPKLRPGDCMIDGIHGRVDATINNQLLAIREQLEVISSD